MTILLPSVVGPNDMTARLLKDGRHLKILVIWPISICEVRKFSKNGFFRLMMTASSANIQNLLVCRIVARSLERFLPPEFDP